MVFSSGNIERSSRVPRRGNSNRTIVSPFLAVYVSRSSRHRRFRCRADVRYAVVQRAVPITVCNYDRQCCFVLLPLC